MKKILNFGALNIDRVYTMDAFVRAGQTVNSLQYTTFPGGKGLNQSVALSLAGAEVYHAGKVGEDGLFLVDLLRRSGVRTEWVSTDGSVTGHALIQVDAQGQNCIIIHQGANGEIQEEEVCRCIHAFERGDFLLLQNEINGSSYIMEEAGRRKMEIAFNPSPFPQDIRQFPLHLVTWLLLNEVEGEELTGLNDPDAIAEHILEQYPQMRIVLTLGKQGVLYRDAGTRLTHEAYNVPVVDTTAAGDTFTGYFLAGVAAEKALPECLQLASAAASLSVSKKGAASSIPAREAVQSHAYCIRKK